MRVEIPGNPEENSAIVAIPLVVAFAAGQQRRTRRRTQRGRVKVRELHTHLSDATHRRALHRPTEAVHRAVAEVIPRDQQHIRRALRRTRRQIRLPIRHRLPNIGRDLPLELLRHDNPLLDNACSSQRRPCRRSWRRLTPCATTAAVPTTAAVRATGAPMTLRRAIRRATMGMSGSFVFVGFERGDQRLDLGCDRSRRVAHRSDAPPMRTERPSGSRRRGPRQCCPARAPRRRSRCRPRSGARRSRFRGGATRRGRRLRSSFSSTASNEPSGSLVIMIRSRTLMIPRSTRSTRVGAISPLNLLPGNSITR